MVLSVATLMAIFEVGAAVMLVVLIVVSYLLKKAVNEVDKTLTLNTEFQLIL